MIDFISSQGYCITFENGKILVDKPGEFGLFDNIKDAFLGIGGRLGDLAVKF